MTGAEVVAVAVEAKRLQVCRVAAWMQQLNGRRARGIAAFIVYVIDGLVTLSPRFLSPCRRGLCRCRCRRRCRLPFPTGLVIDVRK